MRLEALKLLEDVRQAADLIEDHVYLLYRFFLHQALFDLVGKTAYNHEGILDFMGHMSHGLSHCSKSLGLQ